MQILQADSAQIRIMKLKSKRAEPYAFDIDEIYIPLTTLTPPREKKGARTRKKSEMPAMQQRSTALEHAITERRVVIIGDPGSGKSTFLKRVTFELCRNIQGGLATRRGQTSVCRLVLRIPADAAPLHGRGSVRSFITRGAWTRERFLSRESGGGRRAIRPRLSWFATWPSWLG